MKKIILLFCIMFFGTGIHEVVAQIRVPLPEKIRPIQKAPVRVPDNVCLTNALPDLTVESFKTQKKDKDTAAYSIVFKNVGEGCSPCFTWNMYDGIGTPIEKGQVCPSQNWQMKPGETYTVTGEISRMKMYCYYSPSGAMSHLGVIVNHDKKVNDPNIANNGKDADMAILWYDDRACKPRGN